MYQRDASTDVTFGPIIDRERSQNKRHRDRRISLGAVVASKHLSLTFWQIYKQQDFFFLLRLIRQKSTPYQKKPQNKQINKQMKSRAENDAYENHKETDVMAN